MGTSLLYLSVFVRRYTKQAVHNQVVNRFINSRKEATRTPDPYVPNVVRYQLRYFPISGISVEIPVGLYPF